MDFPNLRFHPEAAKRIDERAREILQTVRAIPRTRAANPPSDLHPAYTFSRDDIISGPDHWLDVDAVGNTTGMAWVSGGMEVGWVGQDFKPITALAHMIVEPKPFAAVLSSSFVLDQICQWLRLTLERHCEVPLSTYMERQSDEAVYEHDIWIPLFRTYSSRRFAIGDVIFQSFTPDIMDEWWNRIPGDILSESRNVEALNAKRSKLQGSLAGCVRVRAERTKALDVALSKVQNATSLLRFLSPAILKSRFTSYCTPTASVPKVTRVLMDGDCIDSLDEAELDQRRTDWFVDRSIALCPEGLLDRLHELASNASTEFRRALYQSLILYSRHATAIEIEDKLVFAFSALEAMLLRDGNEPIQKNLGERMAFLIGDSLEARKRVIANIGDVYKIRSAFVHHGKTSRNIETVDEFLRGAWSTFSKLLDVQGKYTTKAELIEALEDRKLA